MINVSQAIKNSCKADKNTHTEYIVINNQTIYIKGKLNATAYKDTTFFGTFNMKVLEFETENTTQFRNRQFEYYKVIDGNAFKVGTFITTQVVDNDSKSSIKVTANDFALKFAKPYTSSLDYESGKITLFDVLEECCTNADVLLDNQSITNGDFIVDSNQFVNGELIGDVICAIAGISGNFGTINNQDKLSLRFTNDTDEVLSDYTDLNDKRDTWPLTSVSIGTSQVEGQNAVLQDQELIEEYGEHWLTINDNPFAYTLEKRQQLITAIFNKVKGFAYSSFTSKYTYRPYLELGDKIKFKNKAGQLIDSIILRYEMDFDDCTFEAPSITSSSVDYEIAPNTAKRAEIIANQAEGSITAVTQELQIDKDGNSQVIESIKTTQKQNSLDIEAITSYETIDGERVLTGVKTGKGFTFNSSGLDITDKNEENTYRTHIDETGTYYYDGETILGQTTNDGSKFKNMELFGEFRYGKENINDNAMFVDKLYTDSDNETGVGTFYNGS